MSQNKQKSNKTLLVIFSIITILAAIAFFPSVNSNVSEGMSALSKNAINTGNLSSEARTIFDTLSYGRSIHILAMLLVGFGFLMAFMRNHGYSSLTATFLAVSISIPAYMLIKSFGGGEFSKEVISINTFLCAEFAAASLLIAMGAVLGRLNMDQYFIMALIFVPAYILNEYIILDSGIFKGFMDVGGSVVIHAFGAYFGMGMIASTSKNFMDAPECETDKTSHMFCLVGSMILWIFWPSFTSAIASPEYGVVTAINTVFALCGSTIATYVCTKYIRGGIEIDDIANAALAGGVAIGSACSMANPGFAMVIGILAGTLSTVGYTIIQPRYEKIIYGTDSCGVHNLHGMPGVLGGLSAICITGNFKAQILAIIATIAIAFVCGRVTGIITAMAGKKEKPYYDEDEFTVEESA